MLFIATDQFISIVSFFSLSLSQFSSFAHSHFQFLYMYCNFLFCLLSLSLLRIIYHIYQNIAKSSHHSNIRFERTVTESHSVCVFSMFLTNHKKVVNYTYTNTYIDLVLSCRCSFVSEKYIKKETHTCVCCVYVSCICINSHFVFPYIYIRTHSPCIHIYFFSLSFVL